MLSECQNSSNSSTEAQDRDVFSVGQGCLLNNEKDVDMKMEKITDILLAPNTEIYLKDSSWASVSRNELFYLCASICVLKKGRVD